MAVTFGAGPLQVPARLADDLEPGGGLGINTPRGVEPVHWLLWTLEPAATDDEALEVVRKYTCRWPIEELHLTLKSGCKVEDLRLETWDGLEKAVTVKSAVAARIVSLRIGRGRRPRPRPWACWRPTRSRCWSGTSAKGSRSRPRS